jgi:hypothetical protein
VLAVLAQGHARLAVGERLVGRGVQDEVVDPLGHVAIDNALVLPGAGAPGVLAHGGQGLGADQWLAVDVGGRGGFADIGQVGGRRRLALRIDPELAHRNVDPALGLQAVGVVGRSTPGASAS